MKAEPLKLLLIEDSIQDARLLREMMVDAGMADGVNLTHVTTLDDALKQLGKLHYDCILLDLHLPDGNGVQNLDRVRERDKETTVVVLTGFNDSEAALEALRRGAQEYAVKGKMEGPALLRLIQHAIERNRLLVQLHHDRQADYHRASHDSLTGLANRQLFIDRLENRLSQATRDSLGLAICFIDLDGFKAVNDQLGHAIGDALLCEVAAALKASVRIGDTVARIGGDEFAVLLPDGREAGEVAIVASRIVARVCAVTTAAGQNLKIGASAGLAMFPSHGTSSETLLANADFAMYQAKAAGKGQYCWFTAESRAKRDSVQSSRQFDTAGLEIHFQPWFRAGSREVVGIEALVRPRGGSSAVPVLDLARRQAGLSRLGTWVLHSACSAWLASHRGHPAPPRLAINISREEMEQPGFAASILEGIQRLEFPANCLQLEVTEQIFDLASDEGLILKSLSQLRAAGIRIAIDQFGRNPGSLGRLPTLPVDVLKLDMHHVSNLREQPASRNYIEGVLAFATALQRELIICGVETASDLENLAGLGQARLQGYCLARPTPPDALRQQLCAA